MNAAHVEADLAAGRLACPVCGGRLARWGHAVARPVRGPGSSTVRLRPRRSVCVGCAATHVLLPTSCLLRRADAVTVIGAALLGKAEGAGHRRAAAGLGRPASTVRGWLRRLTRVADRVRAALLGLAAELGAEFVVAYPAGSVIADVVALVGAVAAAAVRRLGRCAPWRLAAAATGGRLLAPAGPATPTEWINTSRPWAAGV
jgi:hypothetical protein